MDKCQQELSCSKKVTRLTRQSNQPVPDLLDYDPPHWGGNLIINGDCCARLRQIVS